MGKNNKLSKRELKLIQYNDENCFNDEDEEVAYVIGEVPVDKLFDYLVGRRPYYLAMTVRDIDDYDIHVRTDDIEKARAILKDEIEKNTLESLFTKFSRKRKLIEGWST